MNNAPDQPDMAPLRLVAVDLGVLLHSLADMLGHGFDPRIRIKVDAPATLPPVLADPALLEVVLLNIAVNARDAMPNGGLLEFRCDAQRPLPSELRAGPSTLKAGFVAIDISDSGSGMSEAVQQRAFEPAFSTKPGGSGMGLSTAETFVKQSGGTLSLRSAMGAGTTLTLFLPQAHPAQLAAAGGRAVDPAIPAGLRVLLVEDDATVRKTVTSFLLTMGCEVDSAASGDQALQWLQTPARFDLLLSDIALGPGLRGTQLAAEARRRLPGLPILLMSGYSAELVKADHDTPPDFELLRKPFGRTALTQAVAKLMAQRSGRH